jgi:hypothetical protein
MEKPMKEYLFLFHGPKDPLSAFKSPEDMQKHMGKWQAWMGDLAAKGRLVSAQPLEPGGKLVVPGRRPATDGPFLEGKDMIVGGYLFCKAESEAEAVELARGCPILEDLETSVVEIRAVRLMGP